MIPYLSNASNVDDAMKFGFAEIRLALRRLPLSARIGWMLYGVSFVTPSAGFEFIGARMVATLPEVVWHLLHGTRAEALIAAGLSLGLAANLFCFVRVPTLLCIAAVLAPWLSLVALTLRMHLPLTSLYRMLFYFPWAGGLVLLQIPRSRTS
jgi:uncharacterized protein (DUF2062 family)